MQNTSERLKWGILGIINYRIQLGRSSTDIIIEHLSLIYSLDTVDNTEFARAIIMNFLPNAIGLRNENIDSRR
jgi:hypothetical protein